MLFRLLEPLRFSKLYAEDVEGEGEDGRSSFEAGGRRLDRGCRWYSRRLVIGSVKRTAFATSNQPLETAEVKQVCCEAVHWFVKR